jgi:hypothetical protein
MFMFFVLLSSGAHRKREQPTLESTRSAGIVLDVCNSWLPSPIFPGAATVKMGLADILAV